jgi:hypothetical protein
MSTGKWFWSLWPYYSFLGRKKGGVRILFSEEKMMKKESKLNKVMVYVYIVRNNARKRIQMRTGCC